MSHRHKSFFLFFFFLFFLFSLCVDNHLRTPTWLIGSALKCWPKPFVLPKEKTAFVLNPEQLLWKKKFFPLVLLYPVRKVVCRLRYIV